MDIETVRDVLGEPESWPNTMNNDSHVISNMKGATISDVIASGDEIAVHTQGGADGPTFSVFLIEDEDLRARMLLALRPGAPVHEAVAAEI